MKENYYLNKKEINKLIGKMQREGFTIIPTKMYFKKGKAKVEIAVAKGKKQYDKRATKKIEIGIEIKLDILEKQAKYYIFSYWFKLRK